MPRTIKMVSDMDTTMMEVERVDRVGDRLMVTGTMMGSFPTEIFLEPGDLLAMAGMHLRPSPLSFVLGLPYFLLRRAWARAADEGGIAAKLRAVATSAAVALAGCLGAVVIALGCVALLRLVADLLHGV